MQGWIRQVAAFSLASSFVVFGCETSSGHRGTGDFDYADLPTSKADSPNAIDESDWVLPPGETRESMEALAADVNYAEVMNIAVDVGWIDPPFRSAEAPDDVGFRLLDEALYGKLTETAVKAGVVSQLDSPAPGPGDAVAIGILVVGLAQVLGIIIAGSGQAEPEKCAEPITYTCGVPDCVDIDPNADAAECRDRHDIMKWFESEIATQGKSRCSYEYSAVLKMDDFMKRGICEEVRDILQNVDHLARLRHDVGDCYPNGEIGPMGNSDYGHQTAWCNTVNRAVNCAKNYYDFDCQDLLGQQWADDLAYDYLGEDPFDCKSIDPNKC